MRNPHTIDLDDAILNALYRSLRATVSLLWSIPRHLLFGTPKSHTKRNTAP